MILITWLKVHTTEQDFLMFKYMINIIWYGIFRITSRINPLPISSRELCDTERAIYILYIFIVGYMCIFIVNWMQRAIIYTNMWLVLHKDRYNITYNVYFKMYLSISPDHQKQNILPQNTEIRWKPIIWIFCFRSVKCTH